MKTNLIDGSKISPSIIIACLDAELRAKAGQTRKRRSKARKIKVINMVEEKACPTQKDILKTQDAEKTQDTEKTQVKDDSQILSCKQDSKDDIDLTLAASLHVDAEIPVVTVPNVIEIPFSSLVKMFSSLMGNITEIPIDSLIKVTKAPQNPQGTEDTKGTHCHNDL